MGLIEQLIILAKEAIDEANQRGRPQPPAPRRGPPEDPDEPDEEENESLRRILAHRAALARREQQLAEQQAAEQRAELQRQREAQERERELQRQRQRQAEAPRVVHAASAVDPRRIARLVRHPNALREMIVLREILDKPLALRRRR